VSKNYSKLKKKVRSLGLDVQMIGSNGKCLSVRKCLTECVSPLEHFLDGLYSNGHKTLESLSENSLSDGKTNPFLVKNFFETKMSFSSAPFLK